MSPFLRHRSPTSGSSHHTQPRRTLTAGGVSLDRDYVDGDSLERSYSTAAFAGLLVLALVLPLLGCSESSTEGQSGPPSMPPVEALVATAEVRSVQSEISTVGSLRSPETTMVSADVSGIIVSLNAPEGRRIARGHEIARLDDATAQASLQVAEARFKNAKSTLDRVAPLVRDGVVPQQNLDNANAEMATAEGLLEEARTRRGKTRVVAPFSGLVGIQTAQVGQYISSGEPIIQLTQLDPLELIFGVPEEQVGAVEIGQTVEARVGRCGTQFTGTVQALDPQIDQQARTLAVQARVPNRERKLIPGMSARVRLGVGEALEAVVIPREALVARNTGYITWKVADDNTVTSTPVVPGRFMPDVVEIKSGIVAGDRVVAAGHQKLRPQATINPKDWQPTQNQDLALGTRNGEECPES